MAVSHKLAEAYTELTLRLKPFEAALLKARRRLAGTLRKMQARLNKFADASIRIGKKMALGVTLPIVAIGTAMVKMAMDAEESENLFSVSMGKMAKAARKWSQEVSRTLGLNAFEVRRNVATFNTMFVSMGLTERAAYDMSRGLTQLAFDMASFYNLRPVEAFDKLRAGITGEAEPLKRLGILIDETTVKTYAYNAGIVEQGEELTQLQKIQARYVAILDQTQQAQGDLERTANSATNRLRKLQAQAEELAITFGTQLLPIMEKITAAGLKLVNWLQGWTERTRALVTTIAGIAAALPIAALAIGVFTKTIQTLLGALGKLKTAFIWLLKNPIVISLLAVSAAILEIRRLKQEVIDLREEMRKPVEFPGLDALSPERAGEALRTNQKRLAELRKKEDAIIDRLTETRRKMGAGERRKLREDLGYLQATMDNTLRNIQTHQARFQNEAADRTRRMFEPPTVKAAGLPAEAMGIRRPDQDLLGPGAGPSQLPGGFVPPPVGPGTEGFVDVGGGRRLPGTTGGPTEQMEQWSKMQRAAQVRQRQRGGGAGRRPAGPPGIFETQNVRFQQQLQGATRAQRRRMLRGAKPETIDQKKLGYLERISKATEETAKTGGYARLA